MATRRATTRHALKPAGRHKAREVETGRYAAWPVVRSNRPRQADRPPPSLIPPGRITPPTPGTRARPQPAPLVIPWR
jgi:hypothetical protein